MEFYLKKFNELTIDEFYEIISLRLEVFVVEQQSIYQDLDYLDQDALHLYYKINNEIVAYLRIIKLTDSIIKIGRVIAKTKKQGHGKLIMNYALKYLRENTFKQVHLDAQVIVKEFYEKFGFKATSNIFILDGIPHVKMELIL